MSWTSWFSSHKSWNKPFCRRQVLSRWRSDSFYASVWEKTQRQNSFSSFFLLYVVEHQYGIIFKVCFSPIPTIKGFSNGSSLRWSRNIHDHSNSDLVRKLNSYICMWCQRSPPVFLVIIQPCTVKKNLLADTVIFPLILFGKGVAISSISISIRLFFHSILLFATSKQSFLRFICFC